MTLDTVLSGKYGVIDGLSSIRNWSVSEVEQTPQIRASNTRAGTARRPGIYDYSGFFEGWGGTPVVMPGGYFNFTGYTAPTTGVRGTAGEVITALNAICNRVTINWNWRTGEPINYRAEFAAGEPLRLTRGGTDIAVDDTNLTAPSICNAFVDVGESSSEIVWPNIVQMALTIVAENPSFVNSSTACATGRRPGPIDFTLAITEENTGIFNSFAPGDSTRMRLWVDGTTFWTIEDAHVTDISDTTVNPTTGEIVTQTVNLAMDGHDGQSVGVIGRPGEDGVSPVWWWPDTFISTANPFP